MPKEINGFQCEMCRFVHVTEDSAIACEKKHGRDFAYKLEFTHGKAGPESIECTWTKPDGEKYSRNYY
jgi:hypothetical protein